MQLAIGRSREPVLANQLVGCSELHALFSGTVTKLKINVSEFVLTKLTFVADNVLYLLQHAVDVFLRNFQLRTFRETCNERNNLTMSRSIQYVELHLSRLQFSSQTALLELTEGNLTNDIP